MIPKYSLSLLLLLCNTSFLFAQQIPFQGRLVENGTPVTGQRTFQFSITAGNINWSETHTNEPVTNGLYALVLGQNTPLPNNLFASQNSVPLAIQVNGQSLPTATLYAPFESDPTVPDNLKDGVSWDEVTDKPSFQENTTDELQSLSLSGDTLTISDGNSVILSDLNGGDTIQIGEKQTITTTALEQLTSDGTTTRNFLWQSFSVIQDAKLKSIELEFANSIGVDIRFRLYQDEGISGQSVISNDYPAINYGATLEMQGFSVENLADVTLTAGEIYTFYVQGIGDDLLFRRNSTNPYTFGITNVNSTTDAIFRIIVETEEGFTFEVTPSQTTIGTPLTVDDRIKDKTGYVMPVGSIIPYAGSTPPEGWLLCDSSVVRRDLYSDLFAAIGTAWGEGDGSTTFNIPDLRGYFLRGVDNGAGKDPDAAQRIAVNNGNSGDNVGSYQEDEFQEHRHASTEFTDGRYAHHNQGLGEIVLGNSWAFVNAGTSNHQDQTGLSGGAETRPKNAAVNFIIKH